MDNFRIAAGKILENFLVFFNDTDVYKWIEAVSYFLAINKDEKLDKLVDSVIEEIRDLKIQMVFRYPFLLFQKARPLD